MHPIERLRWIARATSEPALTIASEAAWTLGELGADEPAAVVTASRRLVERHPTCGPLWWACAHLVASDDPLETARRVTAELYADTVPDRVAEALRDNFTRSDPLCATVPADVLRDALSRRGSYELRVIAPYSALRHELRGLGGVVEDVTGFEIEDVDEALEGAAVLLVEPDLASAAGLLVEPGVGLVIERAVHQGVPVWALLGTGRVISTQLAEAAAEWADEDLELVPSGQIALAVDDSGPGALLAALVRTSCPPGAELLHRIGR